MHPQTIVVFARDGHNLNAQEGAPARLHSPIKPGCKNAKYGRAFFRRRSCILAAVASCVASQACGGNDTNAKPPAAQTDDSASLASGGTSTAAPGVVADTGCRKEGDWSVCSVEDRLLRSGLILEKMDTPPVIPFFRTQGIAYRVGGTDDEVHVFLYPSSAERERDTAALDSAAASPKGTRFGWKTPPTLVTSNNLAAVILSFRQRTVERIALALGAGLPQPVR